MARNLFGGSSDDYAVDSTGRPIASRRVRFYTSAAMTTEITDLALDAAGTGSPLTVNTDSHGFWGPVYGPDGTTVMYAGTVDSGGNPPLYVVGIYTHTTAVGGVNSFNTRTGAVSLSKADVTGTGLAATDVGADAAGAATAAQTASLQKSSNLSDVVNAGTARTNLGLGTAATVNTGTTSGTVPLLSTGGVLPIARLATGTPDGTKFVRDDGTLASAASVPARHTVLNPSGDATGVTDQAAVQAAVNTLLTAGGGTLELGAGAWYWTTITADIYTTTPARLRIVGQGQATKITSTATGTAGTATALFYVYGGGDVAPFPTTGVQGAVGLNWCDISDMEIIGNGSSCGIAYNGVYQGRIGNVVGHGFTAATKFGTPFYVNYAIDIEVENVIGFSSYNGLYLQGNANTVTGGWFLINNNAGVLVDSNAGGNSFIGTIFQGNVVGIDILSSYNIRLAGTWHEANQQAGAKVRGITNTRSNVVIFDSPYITGPGIVVGSAVDNVTVRGPVNTGVGLTLAVTAGARNIVVEDPPTGMTYSQVQDGTLGTEFSFRRGKAAVATVAASGAAQTIPTPLTADRSVITLTANCTFTFPVPAKGRVLDLTLVQDATGSRTATWPVGVVWPGGTAPTLTTTAGHSDKLRFTSDDGVYWTGQLIAADYNPTAASGPLSVTGLLAWFDATKINSLDNSRITSWTDLTRSGRDLLQEGFTAQPTFYSSTGAKLINSKPAVWFSGSSMVSNAVGGTTAQPTTIYIVCYPTSLTGSPFLYDGAPRQAIFAGTNLWSSFAGSQIDGGAGTAAINTRYILTAVYNGASSVLRSNGAQIAAGNTGANGFSQMTLGARAGTNDLNFTGAICEILVYSGAHSGATLTTVESYLSSKW